MAFTWSAETVVRVNHCLMALSGTHMDDLVEVISHPQAIAQCEEFLTSLDVSIRAEYDTAGAAKKIVDDKLEHTGAIASKRAAEFYGLDILAERIQTYPDNYTRFGGLARNPEPLRTPNKSSLVFGVGHVAGSLYRCIGGVRRAPPQSQQARVTATCRASVGVRLLRRRRSARPTTPQ